MGVLRRDVQRVGVVPSVEFRQGRARFDRVGNEPIVDELERGDVRRLSKGGIGGCLVAEPPNVAGVVGNVVVDERRTRGACLRRIDDRGKDFVVHFDEFGGVLRLIQRFGDDHCDLVADVPYLALRKRRVSRFLHGLAVDVGDQPAAREPVHLAGDVVAVVDRDHPRGRFGGCGIDRADACVRVNRAQEICVDLTRDGHVVRVASVAGQETIILFAANGLAEYGCGHDQLLMAAAPASTALTMLW